MNPTLYAPSKEITVDTFEAALEAANSDFSYSTQDFPVRDLTLDGEGKVFIAGQERALTQDGMRGLCSRFRIPNPFAERIPYDLLKTNILRLAQVSEADSRFTAHIRGDGAIVNISRGLTVPVNNSEIINRTMRLYPDPTPRINLGDRGMDIDLITSSSRTVEARVGDPINVGLRISTSESSFWTGHARCLLYILRCTNGAVMSKAFGHVKLRIKHEHNPNTIYNLFFRKLSELTPAYDNISRLLQLSDSAYFNDEEVSMFWKAFAREEIDENIIDGFFGLTEQDRDNIITMVKSRKRDQESSLLTATVPPQLTTAKVYDTFDKVTSYALLAPQERRQKVQFLAGEMIANLKDRLN